MFFWMTNFSGVTYERAFIEEWFRQGHVWYISQVWVFFSTLILYDPKFCFQKKSPLTNVEQGDRPLVPNLALKEAIGNYLQVKLLIAWFPDHSESCARWMLITFSEPQGGGVETLGAERLACRYKVCSFILIKMKRIFKTQVYSCILITNLCDLLMFDIYS